MFVRDVVLALTEMPPLFFKHEQRGRFGQRLFFPRQLPFQLTDSLGCGQRRAPFIALDHRLSPRSHHRHSTRRRRGMCDVGKDVVVKHPVSGDYRVFHGEECIAWVNGARPKPSTGSNRNDDADEQWGDTFTEQQGVTSSLCSDRTGEFA
ncbi:MAG TPA: hypothetical protein VJV79_37665 [Polyangiaceae bacterium]|nr:hypothetical protein [Polyangiaceae bacterium]